MVVYSCEDSARKDIEEALNIDADSETAIFDEAEKEALAEEEEQSVGDRIIEIKAFYAKIQGAKNKDANCISDSKTIYDGMEGGYPFKQAAKECQLEDNFMYQQVYLNGYEWAETTTFYYKEQKCFFVYTTGGAEACGYDYRVYYNREGEVIRVLLAENECDGQEVSSSIEVSDEKKKQEILNSIANAKKELDSTLKK